MNLKTSVSAVIFTALVSFSVNAIAIAQTPSSPSSSGVASEEQQTLKKPFTISPSGAIELPKGTTTQLKASIAEPPEGLKNSISGVNLNGYVGYVPYEGKKLMVTVIDTISKDDNSVSIPRRIEAQAYRDKTSLSQQDIIKLEVDPADLDTALEQLAEMESKELETKEQPEKTQSTEALSGNSGSSGSGSGGSTPSGNSLAGSYQNPTQTDFSNPQTEIKTSTDGCKVRIDTSQGIAIQQSKTQNFEDGKLKTESECTDSEIRYTLQSTFEGCSDIVDVNALTVYRQSKTYYNKDSARVTVSSCSKDTSSTFQITEDFSGCAPVVDKNARKVSVYAKLVYVGSTNAQVQVRGCSPSTMQSSYDLQKSYESCSHDINLSRKLASGRYKDFFIDKQATRTEVSDCTIDTAKQWPIQEIEGTCKVFLDFTKDDEKAYKQAVMQYTDDKGVLNEARGCDKSTLTEPVSMVKDTNLCSIRHDFEKTQSHQMFIWKYTLDGVAYQASACSDTETIYPHKNYTVDTSGAKVCTPKVDQTARLVTLFYRTGIVVEDNVQYITECKPDSDNKLPTLATTDGCTDPASWQHDLKNGISYNNERWYYTLEGAREYVTPCQQGSTTYNHDVTNIGWQLHDDKLYALPISKVEIDAPIGKYVVSVNTVLDGTVQQPYVLKETKDIVPADQNVPNSYQGCTGIFDTVKTEIYTRPDTTEFNKEIGVGKAVTEIVCNEEHQQTKVIFTKLRTVLNGNYPIGTLYFLEGHKTTYAKFLMRNKYTGNVVSTLYRNQGTNVTIHKDFVDPVPPHRESLLNAGAVQIVNEFNASSTNKYPSVNSCVLNNFFGRAGFCTDPIITNGAFVVAFTDQTVNF